MQPDLLSEFEVEQLLLAPKDWTNACCKMFGISLEGLQVRAGGGVVVRAVSALAYNRPVAPQVIYIVCYRCTSGALFIYIMHCLGRVYGTAMVGCVAK
jgi:hypothetical protein